MSVWRHDYTISVDGIPCQSRLPFYHSWLPCLLCEFHRVLMTPEEEEEKEEKEKRTEYEYRNMRASRALDVAIIRPRAHKLCPRLLPKSRPCSVVPRSPTLQHFSKIKNPVICHLPHSCLGLLPYHRYRILGHGYLSGNHIKHSSQASSRLMVCQTCRLAHGFWMRLAGWQKRAKVKERCLQVKAWA
ncbi:hypothetical protein LZ32DRAFT_447735 [Colletotrichum eremochloae]|nr:hypothetical protein LZ32DRAFT_447735 [Colletotrichum eremochloae]